MRVVITGAAGSIGSQLVEDLSPIHELVLIDRKLVHSRNSIAADLSRNGAMSRFRGWIPWKSSCWSDAFKGADVVIHLAANREVTAPWEKVLRDNIQATWNVIDAAAKCRVPRVVFASSGWAVKALERKPPPGCDLLQGMPKLHSETPPYSLTTYGLSKSFGEIAGRMYVDEGRLHSFVAVRIGCYSPTPPEDRELLSRWISDSDIRSLFRRCVEAELDGFHVVYGVSAQSSAPYDLSHTCRVLSWEPQLKPG